MEVTTQKVIRVISPDTLTIISMFRELDSPEKVVTKDDLRAAIGRDPTGLIPTALRRMLRDHNTVIEWDRSVGGWRNMIGNDNLLGRKSGLSSIRRKARRNSEKLSVIDFAKLTDSQKVETCAVASICGAVAHVSTAHGMKRIESAIQKADAAGLPIGKTLALFHENGTARRDQTG